MTAFLNILSTCHRYSKWLTHTYTNPIHCSPQPDAEAVFSERMGMSPIACFVGTRYSWILSVHPSSYPLFHREGPRAKAGKLYKFLSMVIPDRGFCLIRVASPSRHLVRCESGVVAYIFNPSTQWTDRSRKITVNDQANLVYLSSPRLTWNPVSKQTNKKYS